MKRVSRAFSLISSIALLVACGSTPEKPAQVNQPKPQLETPVVEKKPELTVADYLQRANEASNPSQSTIWYTRAADAWLKQGEYAKAHALLEQLNSELLSPFMQNQFTLFKAEALTGLKQYQLSFNLAKDLPIIQGFEQRVWQVKVTSASHTQHHLAAAKALIGARQYIATDDQTGLTQNSDDTWAQITQLGTEGLRAFDNEQEKQLSGWLNLLNITRTYADTPKQMLVNIRHWQAQYQGHPAASQLPDSLLAALETEPYRPKNVTVFLPLSGKFARQGQVVQQGIMAGYYSQQNLLSLDTLTFVDTNNTDIATLELETDFIIGPLLKSNIEAVQQKFTQIPILLLNQLDELALDKMHYAFSLSPESEARQAAQKLAEIGYQHPIVIAANNSYGKRVAETFISEFTELTNIEPEVAYFKNSQEIKASVEYLMETDASKQRIKTIKALLGNPSNFESDARNRQDVDLIYVYGNTAQIKLLKPYVDINTAPFAKPSPIYTTSNGFSSDLTIADLKDLNGISFSEMPWVLPTRKQEVTLASEMQQLWNGNDDKAARLFAFGYDSFRIIPHLAQMRAFSGFHHIGLSGKLLVEPNGMVSRQLAWAQYKNEQVVEFKPVH
ncbi:hypothetical protein C2869_07485 [Saccharobesus litoralis]|uniref:LppC lipoprotein n=1 Tax=Saccharobesus litoralis TaxID=2172099 RepID=A0A2S0VQ26_9ALTE|nr:penicillin-binding protein activator [Saccharobesus litoralis]AWB66282.1 hypothetical protein C2869_07485 [Saccharobesus litoralis]